MNLGVLIEVAIGLVLVYIIMSLIVLQTREVFAAIMKKRSKDLEKILRSMLAEATEDLQIELASSEGQTQNGQGLSILNRIYDHPLIKTLSRSGGKPSYIPADKFSLALFDVVMTAGTDDSVIQNALGDLKSKLPETILQTVETGIDQLVTKAQEIKNDPLIIDELHQKLDELTAEVVKKHKVNINLRHIFDALLQAEIPSKSSDAVKQLKAGAANLIAYNPQLTATFESLITQAEMNLKKGEDIVAEARANAENWFDDTMDRASGYYKRNAQIWAFFIGLILAALLNVDTIYITQTLWHQPSIRQGVVAVAESYQLPDPEQADEVQLKEARESINALVSTLEELEIPVGWELEALEFYNPKKDVCSYLITLSEPVGDGKYVTGLPINGQCKVWVNPPRGLGIISKLVGILLTAVMAVQGAPFWFEILGKLVNVRSSGTKPEEKKKKADKEE